MCTFYVVLNQSSRQETNNNNNNNRHVYHQRHNQITFFLTLDAWQIRILVTSNTITAAAAATVVVLGRCKSK